MLNKHISEIFSASKIHPHTFFNTPKKSKIYENLNPSSSLTITVSHKNGLNAGSLDKINSLYLLKNHVNPNSF